MAKGESLIIELPKGNGAVKQIEININKAANLPQALRSTILIGKFDSVDSVESVWTPVGDFFNNVGKSQPFDMWERSVKEDGTMVCRWMMPYKESGSISLKNL